MLDAEPISLTFGWSELTGRKNDHGAKWLDTEFSMRYMIIKHFITFCIFYVDKRAVVFINMNPKFFERLNENTLKTRICHWTAEVTKAAGQRNICGQFQNGYWWSRTVLTICFKPLGFLQRRNVSCYHGFWWHSTASKTSVPAFDCLVPESAVRSHSWEENKQTQTELPKERFRGAHWKYERKQGNLCMVCLLQWNVVPPKLREQDLSLPSIWLLRSIDFSLKLKTLLVHRLIMPIKHTVDDGSL